MTFQELPQETQKALIEQKKNLHKTMKMNNAYYVCFINEQGTRFFRALRTHYMNGVSYWRIAYGKTIITRTFDEIDGERFKWTDEGQMFGKAANGTIIPKTLNYKKDVIALAKEIGIFKID